MNKRGMKAGDLFEKFDQDRNQMLSASELKVGLKELLHFDITQEEVKTMHEFFKAKYRRSEIRKEDLKSLLETPSVRKYDSNSAKSSL
jgi:Ca2+-binding EF-hand superfamily protein